MNIDERLESLEFPLPTIREINQSKSESSISLGLGELKDFSISNKIISTFINELKKENVNYSQNSGIPELRKIIAENQSKEDGFDYSINNVVITIGVQNAIYSTIKTLNVLGAKRVLIPEINFGIYKKIPKEFGLKVETYPLNEDFGINVKGLEKILSKDDIVIINSPANPTGRVLNSSELETLGNLFKSNLSEGYVLSDEIYSKLVYDCETPFSFSKYFDRTIVLNGISKSGAAAGLRVGWLITKNDNLSKAIISNNASIISSPPTPNQYAAIPVVNGETKYSIAFYNKFLKENRDIVESILDDLEIKYNSPKGGFYIFPDLSNYIKDTKEFCLNLARKDNGVVLIPGAAFGKASNIRISLASNYKNLVEGMKRFKEEILNYK